MKRLLLTILLCTAGASYARNYAENLYELSKTDPAIYRQFMSWPTPKLVYNCTRFSQELHNGQPMVITRLFRTAASADKPVQLLINDAQRDCSSINANMDILVLQSR